jgi:hypothetical protein
MILLGASELPVGYDFGAGTFGAEAPLGAAEYYDDLIRACRACEFR